MRLTIGPPTKHPKTPYFQVRLSYTDPHSGKYKQTWRSTKATTEREARKEAERIREEKLAELYVADLRQSDKQPFGEWLEGYFLSKELRPKTRAQYESYANDFLSFASPNIPLCNLSRTICNNWLATFEKLSVRAAAYRTLKAILTEAVLDGKLEKNPFKDIRAPKPSQKLRDYFRDDNEFVRFWEAMPERQYSERLIKAATLLAYETGLRSGEVRHLEATDIRWSDSVLLVRSTSEHQTKNGQERWIRLNPRIEQALQLQLSNKLSHSNEAVRESELIFPNEAGGPYEDSKLSKLFCNVRKVWLPDRGLHFHSLRHSFGQQAYNAGVPLVEISLYLGHSGIEITSQNYAKSRDYVREKRRFDSIDAFVNSHPAIGRQAVLEPEKNSSKECEASGLTTSSSGCHLGNTNWKKSENSYTDAR